MPTRGVVWAVGGVAGQGLAGLGPGATNGPFGADRAAFLSLLKGFNLFWLTAW